MSWSIYLSGSREFVQRELQAAHDTIRTALATMSSLRTDIVDASLSGHGYENVDGETHTDVSCSVRGHNVPAPPPQPQSAEADETAPDDIPF